MKKLSQKQVWNKIAEDWKKFRERYIKEVEDFVRDCSGSLLDLGCGSGRHFIKKEGLKIYGVDFSEEMIKLAGKNAKTKKINVELKLMQNEKIPYFKEFFDNIICVAVLHCVETREGRKKLLSEMKRVLKPGGRALILVWNSKYGRVKNKGKEAIIPWTTGGNKLERYYYLYNLEELKEDVERIGFKLLNFGENYNLWVLVEK
jgi:ubiquinone/menaquinone biosynthesis C-methylase UbiE